MLEFSVKIQIHNFSNEKSMFCLIVLNLDILVYTSCQAGPPLAIFLTN